MRPKLAVLCSGAGTVGRRTARSRMGPVRPSPTIGSRWRRLAGWTAD